MPQPSDPTSPDGFGRPAILRFVERLNREIGPSRSFNPATVAPALPIAPDCAGHVDAEQLCEAGKRALESYPGPVGELIARELEAAASFGFRFARGTLLRRLVDAILDQQPLDESAVEPVHGPAIR